MDFTNEELQLIKELVNEKPNIGMSCAKAHLLYTLNNKLSNKIEYTKKCHS